LAAEISKLFWRMTKVRLTTTGILVLLPTAAIAWADDRDQYWPAWRGPHGTGAAAANPPANWSETENVKWKVKLAGEGLATPIIWGDFVFVQAAVLIGKRVETAARSDSGSDARPPQDAPAGSVARRMLDRFDTNKDGKISRAEVSEGPLRGIFDRMMAQYKLDPNKTYTREELEKTLGATPKSESAKAGDAPQRPRLGGGQGGPGGFGGMRAGRPTAAYQFVLMCLDRKTGKLLWQKTACEAVPHEGHHPQDGSFAAASPVTDGKHVYAYFGSRGLYCYDMTGELKWSQDLGDARIAMTFGEGSSPTLYGNTIIVNWDHEGESFIVALDATTGATLWRKPRDERTSWSTPLVVSHGGKLQVVTTATRKIRSYDLASGELVWECGGLTPNVIPSPVAGGGMLFATSGFRGNALLAIRLGRTGDLTGTDAIVWSHGKGTPYVPSPLLYGDRLYLFSNNNAILSSFDAKSGKPLIDATRIAGMQSVYASPIGAGGRVYLVGRDGAAIVIKDADKLEVLATNRLSDRFDASPAVAGNELFLRGREHLYCIAEK
jgi:outer membrane protein assembly factor BamB